MNANEYIKMKDCEDQLWWYKALHRYLLQLLPIAIGQGSTALDVGCGTGGFMHTLSKLNYKVLGFDISFQAATYAHERGTETFHVLVGNANDFPVLDESVDLVSCIDVLECSSISPPKVVAEVFRVLRPGGVGILQMASYQWLLSEHDDAVHSVRRYSYRELKGLLRTQNFDILYMTHLYAILFPLLATWKLFHPSKKDSPIEEATSDVRIPLRPINDLLYLICVLESKLLPRFVLPFGTSICALIKKK